MAKKMAKNGKKNGKKLFFFTFLNIFYYSPTKVPRTQLMMSYAAAVVSVGAPARAPAPAPARAPAPVAPSPATAKNAPEPVHRCNVGHCDLCNMLRDPIGYGVYWTINEDGIESGM